MSAFKLAEHFVSINGEGQLAGALALFLRFAGCNLRCDWCDTSWANGEDAPYELVGIPWLVEIANKAIEEHGVQTVTLTGGEQKDMVKLIHALIGLGMRVEIETNGAVPIEPFMREHRPVFTVDYKLPSSGMERYMHTENIALLRECDTLKLVCGSRADLDRAAEVIEEYKPQCPVFLSPVFGRIEPAEMVEFMKAHRLGTVRLQLQLHKFIWDPEKRGV